MKRAIIIHGWGGSPNANWIPWLKKELEARNIFVEAPQMPNTDNPTIDQWVPYMAKLVDEEDDNYLIGHSIGCQTILRYLANMPEPAKIKGVVFVAGWLTLSGISSPEEKQIAEEWAGTPIDLGKAKASADKFVSIFSDDDPYVEEDNWAKFEELGDVIVEHGKGHILEAQDDTVLKSVLKIMKI